MADEDDNLFGQAHVDAYRASGGEHGYDWRGTQILLLTTTGRKSGEPRTTPLIHVTDGERRWVVIASKGGAPEHPGWFANLEAEPDATIQVKADEIPVRMSVVEGPDRDRLWGLMTEAWPAYDDYAAKTDRHIPVVLFEPR
ncbi:MAG TPA: nitroreductase family deazaflavin-dependent oxidoreductase [Solirubrobacteraceae bacterium]|jgi:deazaflavin-dependent oxidoreductase (nitroreductase family)|nr:nitroreductase family deazaflavin-dependent oxidoreductase [Solirubrobacteraceae bacterium]